MIYNNNQLEAIVLLVDMEKGLITNFKVPNH